jgi:L-ascorbate metabolism protein UlaG (beta-lactamase superfamily)
MLNSAGFRALVAFAAGIPMVCADRIPAAGGDIEITPIMHASVQVEHAGIVIHIDPWSKGDFSRAKPADLILITGVENDHFDLAAIQKIRKPGAPVVIPAAAKDKLADGTVLANGETKDVAGIRIEAMASYDLIPGDPFHPKGRGNGYVVTLGGKRIYFSGVTECVPEVQALKNIEVAFICFNSPQGRMTPAAAARCVAGFQPKIVYPYHYREGKVQEFKDALKNEPIEVRTADWYPAASTK